VLERIAAVVTIPHRKDFGALLKKNLLNFCGELAIKIPEIILRNKRIEGNSRANDIIARTNPLWIVSTKKLMMGSKPDQSLLNAPVELASAALKNCTDIKRANRDRNP
jgi:hypothetical protein